MQLPDRKTPVAKCIHLGLYSQTAFAQIPDNPTLAALALTLADATAELAAAQTAYAAAVIDLIKHRVRVRFTDHSADAAVRATQRAAEAADAGKGGKIAGVVFPGGVTPVVRPVGRTQVAEMVNLEGRLDAAKAIWSEADAEKAKIFAEREKYEAALGARRNGMQAVADLRAKRDLAKEDFLDVYATCAARVKAEFPRDRKKQDLFFDKITKTSAGDDLDDEELGDDDLDGGDGVPPLPTNPA